MRRQATPMITSIENVIEMLRADSTSWNPMEPKWFRGEPRGLTPLLPTLYREGLAAFENPLLQADHGPPDIMTLCRMWKEPISGSF